MLDSAQAAPDEASSSGRTESGSSAQASGRPAGDSHGLPSAEELLELLADREAELEDQQLQVRSLALPDSETCEGSCVRHEQRATLSTGSR